MHFLCNGIRNGASDAAADNTDLFQPVHLGRTSERPDDIGNNVAFLNGVEHFRGASCRLNHNGHGTLLAVIPRDGNGNALSLLVKAEDNKLTRLSMTGDQRRLYFKKADRFRIIQKTLGNYFIHPNSPKNI